MTWFEKNSESKIHIYIIEVQIKGEGQTFQPSMVCTSMVWTGADQGISKHYQKLNK